MDSKVLIIAKEIVETCQKHTSSVAIATSAIQVAEITALAEWNRGDVSKSPEESSSSQPPG